MSPTEPAGSRLRWLILALIGVAQLMVVLDATIVNIALPSAQQALGFSDESRQWVVTAYALSFGSLLLFGGRLGDLFGRKRVFITGLGGFALASALGGFAPNFGVLVSARALQGAFARAARPGHLEPADHDLHAPRRAQPRLLGLRHHRRLGRRGRPDPRWRADRVPRLALDDVRQPHPRRPGRRRRRPAAAARRSRGELAPGPRRHADRVLRAVRARLRVLQRRDPRLGLVADARHAERGRCPARRASSPSSSASRIRCCRCASSPIAPAPAASSPSPSSAPGSSASSSSSPSTCSRPSASRRSSPAWPSCR